MIGSLDFISTASICIDWAAFATVTHFRYLCIWGGALGCWRGLLEALKLMLMFFLLILAWSKLIFVATTLKAWSIMYLLSVSIDLASVRVGLM